MSDRDHHDGHDDGLVHGHGWACSEQPPHAAALQAPRPAARRRYHHSPRPELDHDDGLVHDHAWARSERISAYAAE